MFLNVKRLVTLLLFLGVGTLRAQTVGNSPYSALGIGDLYSPGFIPSAGMGGLGVSNANGFYVNHVNPALLARNRIAFFEAGLLLHFKGLSEGERTQQVRSGNINYLSFSFPAGRRWSLGLSLMPYSRVDYTSRSNALIFRSITDFTFVNYEYRGTGGITQANLTNGWNLLNTYRSDPKDPTKRIVQQSLYVGLEATFLFGNVNREIQTYIDNDQNNKIAFTERTNVTDFTFKPGLAYQLRLKDKLYLNAGATHTFAADVNARRLTIRERRIASEIAVATDTLEDLAGGSLILPAQYQFGLSLESPFRWTVGADVTYQPWSKYRAFGVNGALSDTYQVSVGGEFTPDPSSISSYFKRATFRLGANYSQLPYNVNGQQLDDRSVSLGTSLPMARGFSDLNLSFALGQRGTNGPIRENYFKVFVGFTLRDNQWFLKRKID